MQILIFKVDYFENTWAYFNDFGLIMQDFEWRFQMKSTCFGIAVPLSGSRVS